MDEASLKQSLQLYRSQLEQIEQSLQIAGADRELLQLREEMRELILLTEEGLLALVKSRTLTELDRTFQQGQSTSSVTTNSLDEEYAAFQASLGETQTASTTMYNQEVNTSNPSITDQISNIVGMKCRAPFVHEWGSTGYFNAIVTSVEESDNTDDVPKVNVMYCNPTSTKMVPCAYHLEGKCRFSKERCKYSHGNTVDIEDLEEFKEPDFSSLHLDSQCLVRYDDDVWYRAKVVDLLDNHQFTVSFDNYRDTRTVDIADVLPLDGDEEDYRDRSSQENEEEEELPGYHGNRDPQDNEEDLPVYLWKPPNTTEAMGGWEAHTKGIGSKLMAKMGYVVGQGLGKEGCGRTEPVPIQLIPQGKSLDKIMELKELAGDQDLFDAMKKEKKKAKKQEEKNKAAYNKMPTANIFDFINKKLGGKRGDVKSLVRHHQDTKKEPAKHVSEKDLHAKSDRGINVQLFKTHEEMKKVERELVRLRQGLSRNEDKDRGAAEKIRQKIQTTEAYLQKLKSSEQAIESHKQKRSDKKKLTIF